MEVLMLMDAKTTILGISAIVALYAVYRNAEISRRRATVDLVLHQRNDQVLVEANKTINPILKSNNITRFSDDEHKDSEERKAILEVLNNYEFIASGIREKAFDINIYKRMSYGIVMRDWECFEPFIIDLRRRYSRPTLFQEFQWLAKQFESKKLKKDKP